MVLGGRYVIVIRSFAAKLVIAFEGTEILTVISGFLDRPNTSLTREALLNAKEASEL